MKKVYILTEAEIKKLNDRLMELRTVALMSRDAAQKEDSREFYLRAKGFQEAMEIIGLK